MAKSPIRYYWPRYGKGVRPCLYHHVVVLSPSGASRVVSYIYADKGRDTASAELLREDEDGPIVLFRFNTRTGIGVGTPGYRVRVDLRGGRPALDAVDRFVTGADTPAAPRRWWRSLLDHFGLKA
jgi:hypothetical protein